jgi:hypothetical protein
MTFNGAGLHIQLRNILGGDRLNRARVVNINNATDWLSQGVENTHFGADASSQVGVRYEVEGAAGHKLSSTVDKVSQLWSKKG